jgi:hypothetical protein
MRLAGCDCSPGASLRPSHQFVQVIRILRRNDGANIAINTTVMRRERPNSASFDSANPPKSRLTAFWN